MSGRIAWVCCVLCALGSPTMGEDIADEADDLSGASIPPNAVERPGAYRPLGDIVDKNEYFLGDTLVGERLVYKNGRVAEERIYRNGKLHGYVRQWWPNGKLFAVLPFREGVRDGRFRFWDENGKLLGESVIRKGTGTLREFENLQFASHDAEIPYVNDKIEGVRLLRFQCPECPNNMRCENRSQYVAGKRQCWTMLYCGKRVVSSLYFKDDKLHCVHHKTDTEGRALEGYPKYYVNGKELNEKAYLEAAKKDEELRKSLKPPTAQQLPSSQG